MTAPWILENTLEITPAEEDERPVKRTQDAKWALNLAAAQQFHAREGHLRVPRKHAEELETEDGSTGRQGSAGDNSGPSPKGGPGNHPRSRE
ncbi:MULTISPECIES: helicase associated domain-containing protein [unclassified Streptomyces]|uniref:helicase associated domain-containing protein n=1 Tax=unclassified Streptomyces TaxID=2593676 RepID=UPI002F917DB9